MYVCHSEDEWLRQKSLWTGHGSRYQAHWFVSRTATRLGFTHSKVSHVYQELSTTQRTSSQIDTTVGSFGVNMGWHPCRMLSTPCRVHSPVNWKLSLMFCTLSVCCPKKEIPKYFCPTTPFWYLTIKSQCKRFYLGLWQSIEKHSNIISDCHIILMWGCDNQLQISQT